MGIALDSPEYRKLWTVDAIACAGLAHGILAAQDLALPRRVLSEYLGDIGAERDVAQALNIERPLTALFVAKLTQFLNKPVKQ